jgi:EAL domain-containing protein (putative c-di-GMP-specific phosphodiesterase class I)
MYAAKRDGKGRCRVFSDDMRSSVITRTQLQTELNDALALEQFVLHYQPVINQQSGRLEAVEALLRWNHPERGLLPLANFIGLAEESGLIVPLGAWVTKEATRQAKALQNDLAIRLSVSVHLSPQQLTSDIVSMVRSALTESQLDPQDLVLEIAESCLMTPKDLVITQLQALRGLGVRIAIDDFGNGYSSRGSLRRLPVDILKIDRSFADRITDGPQASALTEAIINLACTLDLRTIAEGIETLEQAQALRGLGCHSAQGHYFCPPLAPEQLLARLRDPVLSPMPMEARAAG